MFRKHLLPLLLLACVLALPARAEQISPHLAEDTELASCFPTLGAKGPVPFAFDSENDSGELEVWFGRISCCDGFVLRCGGETMMIDGGDRNHGAATERFVSLLGLTHVDYLFNTHYHDDHLQMQMRLLQTGKLTADVFLTPYERDYPVAEQRAAQENVDRHGIEYRTLHDGDSMRLGGENGALLEFFRWSGSTNANYASLMCRVTYGERSLFLLADVCSIAQKDLALTRPDIPWKSDIVKAGHHGYTGQNTQLLRLLDPEMEIVTNSLLGGRETVDQMKREKIPYMLTNLGTIYLHTDGGDVWKVYQDKTYLTEK